MSNDADAFYQSIEQLQRRAAELERQRQANTLPSPEALHDALEELATALEELKVAQEELRAQNEELLELRSQEAELRQRYQELFEQAPDAYLVTDLDGQIEAANRAAHLLFGREDRALVGKPLVTHIDPEGKAGFRLALNLLRQEGARTNWEVQLQPREGEPATVSITVRATPGPGGFTAPVRWTIRDITQLKRLEEELLRARHIESLGTLAGGLAHDFNNYLTALLGDLGLAKRRVGDDQEARALLERAEQTTLLATGLSKQLLTFAKGGAPITQPVSTRELIEHSVQFALRGGEIALRLSLGPDLWPADADEGQISQVLANLLKNAQEAMPAGGTVEVRAENITVAAHAPVPPLPPGPYLRISVIDEGGGISPEQARRIFDPYYSTKAGGSGLGLATAHSIVARHHGLLTFHANLSGGTTFEIYLPASPQATVRPKVAAALPRQGKGKVLVVDDEALLRVVVTAMLKEVGYTAVAVNGGDAAVECYREAKEAGEPFDVVLMDLLMPGGLSGEEATQAILEVDAAAKVIASSGYSSRPTLAEYQDRGFRAIAPKPYTIETLTDVLDTVITS